MRLIFLAVALCLTGSAAALAAPGATPEAITPANIHWYKLSGMDAGTWGATLAGDSSKPGPYVNRQKLFDGYRYPPHFHDGTEFVTVLQGTLLIVFGDRYGTGKRVVLTPGSFIVVPAKMHHYALAKGETIIQLEGDGPYTETMIHSK